MTSKEKRDTLLREVVKPELKNAGYRLKGRAYISMRDNGFLAIGLSNGRFISNSLGFSFGFSIQFFSDEFSEERLKNTWNDCIDEAPLLPDYGFLHPYRSGLGYTIDGYKNYQPQDMDVEDIKNCVRDDLHLFIFPQLAEINCYEEWKRKKQEWYGRYYSKRVSLLHFYSAVQYSAVDVESVPHRPNLLRESELPADEIKENYPLYQQIKALSPWPNEDKWFYILAILKAEETKQ